MSSIKKFQLSACFIVPAIWNRIAQECTRGDVSSIRFAMSGASPLPLPLQLKVHDMLPEGVALRVNWGMTETITAATQPNVSEMDKEGSSGRLLPSIRAVILGAEGEKLGYDEPGELCVRGKQHSPKNAIIFDMIKGPTSSNSSSTTRKPRRPPTHQTVGSELATLAISNGTANCSLSVDPKNCSSTNLSKCLPPNSRRCWASWRGSLM